MFLELEKRIVNNDYINLDNDKKIWAFGKTDDITSQINLEQNNGKYTFSFPINDIHYSTSFIDKSKLRNYIEYIIGEIH
jgi:hypothetical protein|tara:strand:+ start:1113 stop:1349 length:237 start_codon:yes stop_codon:yes gene_type:complete